MILAIVRKLTTFCLTAGLASISLMAQGPLQVTIPFDFTVGSKSFASGEYRVRPNLTDSVLAIQSADGHTAIALARTLNFSNKPGVPRLVFNRYGDRYFLSQVWASGGQGRELPRTTAEQELIAKAKSAKSVDLIAASRK